MANPRKPGEKTAPEGGPAPKGPRCGFCGDPYLYDFRGCPKPGCRQKTVAKYNKERAMRRRGQA